MSRKYKFHNPDSAYFITFAVVGWINVFTRNVYRNIFVDSLNYCVKNKGLEIYAWCLMSNHVHMVSRAIGKTSLSDILRDMKKFTSKELVNSIISNPSESRKEWMLNVFRTNGEQTSNVKNYQFWRHDNKPIEVWSNKIISRKINNIHNNPVKKDWS